MKNTQPRQIDCIVGARPNFMKIAPILRALSARQGLSVRLIHTGQHYDVAMNEVFFDELAIPKPDINLEIGSSTQAQQTANIMIAIEAVFNERAPDLVVVVGDVNSTLAVTLVAAKMSIPVVHVEAGLRSFDRQMPEEINRLVTDRLSDLFFTTEREANEQLLREGEDPDRIHFVGNVMIDTLFHCRARARPSAETMQNHGANPAFLDRAKNGFGFATLHRPSNVDDAEILRGLLNVFAEISQDVSLVFALHPRTRAQIEKHGLASLIEADGILLTPPLPYLETIGLVQDARLVLTDSGGLQEESTALGVPCLTLRANTERPITISEGTNVLTGSDPEKIRSGVKDIMETGGKSGRIPDLWDGKAAERIADVLETFLQADYRKVPAA